ncbi:MAG: putative glyoxalase superfamily protein PhnB [Planctomycetota bacterium]|jgi:uncharacterized glyoxalase superfamily protein PhnB
MSASERYSMSVMLTCRDCPSTVAHYRDVLGFELKESWPSDAAPQWANLVLKGQSVMLGAEVQTENIDAMCGGDAEQAEFWRGEAKSWSENRPGVGLAIYLQVDDVDAYAREIKGRGADLLGEPKDQFHGIREQRATDPEGYKLVFFTPIEMTSCQSCGMPLTDAEPGQMYCGHCTNDKGELRPFEQVLEGTTVGYFMGMQQMPRAEAEVAAKDRLSKMAAWSSRCNA